MPIKLAISGAAGRMGRRIIALAHEDDHLQVTSALEHAESKYLGEDVGLLAGVGNINVLVGMSVDGDWDVLIDFSTPAGTMTYLDACLQTGRRLVTGTTGLDADQGDRIASAAREIPIVSAANMSVGVNVLLRAVKMMAATLDASFDVEISETHHRFKVDAPSGTAIALRDAVVEGRTVHDGPDATVVYGREGQIGPRPAGEIGMHALRVGDTVGEHTVHFGSLGETLTLGHSAHSRDTFATGALRAAQWLAGKDAGLYSMQDVLFDG